MSHRAGRGTGNASSTASKPLAEDKTKKDDVWCCGICHQQLDNETYQIGCDGRCQSWYHARCVNIDSKEYKKLAADSCSEWLCPPCKGSTDQVSVSSAISQAIQQIRADVNDNILPKVILPDPDTTSSSIDEAVWGGLKGAEISNAVNEAYRKAVTWKKNLFKVPTGKAGQEFIEEVTKVLGFFISGSHFESVAITMVMIMFPLLLQKPSQKSKSKDHSKRLAERLILWKSGELFTLIRQCSKIQDRLKDPKANDRHHEKVFTRLMLQGKVSAALRWVGSQRSGLLDVDDEVVSCLKEKHPIPGTVVEEALLKGPVEAFEDIIFDSIDAELVQRTSKSISGAAGPSGADAEIWKQILCSKQFKKKPEELCTTIAALAKKLSCRFVNPDHLHSYTAGRLIPLDKKPGVRPIGIGEVLRRIVGKAITSVLKPDIVESTAPIQVCAGLPGGVEAAIHAMRRMYNAPDCQAVLLVDAENAFNSLNRMVALHNMKFTCPNFYRYTVNTYRQPAKMFIANTEEQLLSQEGTTQGDTSAMGMYAVC